MKKIKKKQTKKPSISDSNLTPQQELFCQCYAGYHDIELFSNKTRSYIYSHNETDRYNKLLEQKIQNPTNEARADFKRFHNLCAKLGSNLFKNVQIIDRVNKLFDELHSDSHVDRELSFTITQRHDLASKVQAIREFNRIRNRIKKTESTDTVTFTWESGDNTATEPTSGPKTVTITRKIDNNEDDVEFDD